MNLYNHITGKEPEPNFKERKCVSGEIREFAEGQTCTLRMPWCNNNPETVVHCHTRRKGFNGWNCKPLDFFGYHGCSECHRRENEAGTDDLFRAFMETQNRLYQAGILQVKGQ